MAMFRTSSVVLMDVTDQTEALDGAVYEIKGAGIDLSRASFAAGVNLRHSGGAGDPSSSVGLHTSVDGETWYAVGGIQENSTLGESRVLADLAVFRFVRAKMGVFGETPPSVDARFELVCDEAVTFELVA